MNWTYIMIIGAAALNLVLLIILLNKISQISSRDTLGSLAELADAEREKQQKYMADEFRSTRIEINQGIRSAIDSQNKLISFNTIENERRLEAIRITMENRLSSIQNENSIQLDKMRETVDEKLQKTLESRISESFKMVSERLEQVYKGLGEMQTLASGVGDLKKVLSNVKSRGVLGEIQLGAILEEILTKEQYEANVVTKKGSQSFVEYAIKLPGDSSPVYLPIDAKFPADAYSKLLESYDSGDLTEIESSKSILIKRLKSFAKDIHDKYIDPPNTTEFAIMFLPFEGLYAEAVRLGMVEELQRLYKINIAGPTTTAALLNSLQMGFKTLAIQKRSSEVWDVLGAVKTEFDKFETVLESAQSRIEQANSELDKLIGVRTRQIKRKLKDVEAIENPDAFIGEDTE
ncbi:MAG: DNA recombination protein RmuC [Proteocatella sp.]|nr:DNA recombination protein RmuC [Proteocatella sp.]MBP7907820.1 DNA recombination protein RmuC [Proteocatella sp.]MBP8654496.1 DNA recombination protein RmuC [Proteocatella sp.]MBP9967026.1 DNA recombination protein RmuC [Proteocatella sp.]NCB72786.1 DNA recombination protein RmuC [Clostridia bacterium]